MGRVPSRRAGDGWGRPPADPFLRRLHDDPDKAARLQTLLTVGMILFWIFLALGLLFVFYMLIFG
ncbi:MAG: hypothetical protein ACMUIE_06670 [Thermoplasmatota archaeon]